MAEEMYIYLEVENLLPNDPNGCKRKSRGTKDQLLVDKKVLNDCRKRHTNIAMVWIDYKKANDFVPIWDYEMWYLILKMGKKILRQQDIELPNGETMKEVEQEEYTYLGTLELDKIK